MVQDLKTILTLKGASGKKYEFSLFSFDDYDEIKRYFNEVPALYIFVKLSLGKMSYDEIIYLGETGNVHTRFDAHHKEDCIKSHNANCVGFYVGENFDEESYRLAAEEDLLDSNDFPCNDTNN